MAETFLHLAALEMSINEAFPNFSLQFPNYSSMYQLFEIPQINISKHIPALKGEFRFLVVKTIFVSLTTGACFKVTMCGIPTFCKRIE